MNGGKKSKETEFDRKRNGQAEKENMSSNKERKKKDEKGRIGLERKKNE
jgi:hypothetical protein